MTGLSLGYNQLSGSIPPELGNLTNLQWLYLVNNQLSGKPPMELMNLVNLSNLRLGYNHLTTTGLDPALDAFLLQKDPSWKEIQTAPTEESTEEPTEEPTVEPTEEPTVEPTTPPARPEHTVYLPMMMR